MKPSVILFRLIIAATAVTYSVNLSASAPSETVTVYVTGPRSSKISLQRTKQGQIFLTLKVRGQDLDFLLDTGAPNTCIDAAIAKDLGIAGDPASERVIAMGGSLVADVSAREDISVGEMLVHRCPIHLIEMKEMRAKIRSSGFKDFHGFVGVDLLEFLRGRLQFDEMSLVIRRP